MLAIVPLTFHQWTLHNQPSFSIRSFPLWNKWQTAAFPFLPVLSPFDNERCLPFYSFLSVVNHEIPDRAAAPFRVVARIAGHLCDVHAHLKSPLVMAMSFAHSIRSLSAQIVNYQSVPNVD